MIDEQIRDGDFVVVEDRKTAENGEMVIALFRGSDFPLKKVFPGPGRRLPPHARRRGEQPVFGGGGGGN